MINTEMSSLYEKGVWSKNGQYQEVLICDIDKMDIAIFQSLGIGYRILAVVRMKAD